MLTFEVGHYVYDIGCQPGSLMARWYHDDYADDCSRLTTTSTNDGSVIPKSKFDRDRSDVLVN